MKSFYFLCLFLTSCAHSETASVDAKNEGDVCGGFAGLRCAEHLVCKREPSVADSFGVCVLK